jgi:hypothetical protein
MLETLQALLTPLIGVITAYVAYQQYRIRKDERSLVMYDRRLAIFKNAVTMIDRVRAGLEIRPDEALTWLTSVAEANFLFGEEIPYILDEVFGSLYEYACLSEGKPKVTSAVAEAALAVEDTRAPLHTAFKPYLRLAGSAVKKSKPLSLHEAMQLLPAKPAKAGSSDSDIPF